MDTAVLAEQKLQEAIDLLDASAADSEAAKIDRLQFIERAKRRLSATQAKATHALIEQRHAVEIAEGVPVVFQLQGLDAEVGLARGESPYVGAALTETATALGTVLPNTLAALAKGQVSEYHTRIVAEQTSHLSDAHRREIDAAIGHRLGKASSGQLRKLIQAHALRLDREASTQRAARNSKRMRRVWMEPASADTVYVSAELPTHQGVAVIEAIVQRATQRLAAAAAAGQDNPEMPRLAQNQAMADLFVELLTGQTSANGVTAEVIVVMDDATLFGDENLPGWIPGQGPIPAGMVKDWLADPEAKKFLRRMYTRPTDGQLVALESRARRFPAGLAKMLLLRDDTCATPGCNSPIQDADHRRPWAKGGPTSWKNATGLCKRCNRRKELRGWKYGGTVDQLTVTTPTGHSYRVGTRPLLADIRLWNSDPPITGPVDIAFSTTTAIAA